METRERGNWTWLGEFLTEQKGSLGQTTTASLAKSTQRLVICTRKESNLEEEVESLAEHPVEGGEVEEVGEGEGRAQQGLRQLRWHLVSSRRENVI